MPLKKTIKNDKGFALMITIMIFCLIVPLTLQFNTTTEFQKVSAANLKFGTQLTCTARSGLQYALAVLYQDARSTEYDSEVESWAETLTSGTDSDFGDAAFTVKIGDHSGRININRLVMQENPGEEQVFDAVQKDRLTLLLQSLDLDLEDDEIGDIINSIKDWIDRDNEITDEGGIGAESAYYQGLSRPCLCRNGPLPDLEELSLIKGIDKVIYDEMAKYLTIYGKGEININTAPNLVLASLSDDMDTELAENMIEYRNDEKNDLSTIHWTKDVSGMNDITLDHITVISTHFEIISIASRGEMKKTIKSMVKREEKGTIKVLTRKVY